MVLVATVQLATKWGTIGLEPVDRYYSWSGDEYSLGSATIEVQASREVDEHGATLDLRLRGADEADLAEARQLLAFGEALVHHINAAQGDERAEAIARAAEEREREAAEAAKRDEAWAERSERLLTEFLGEKVRIRLRGMRRWRPATVESQETTVDGELAYVPCFRYVYEKHGYMERNLRGIVALEVKVGSRYQSVWNDGTLETSQPQATRNYQGGLS